MAFRLRAGGVRFHARQPLAGWNSGDECSLLRRTGERAVRQDAVVLALGGGAGRNWFEWRRGPRLRARDRRVAPRCPRIADSVGWSRISGAVTAKPSRRRRFVHGWETSHRQQGIHRDRERCRRRPHHALSDGCAHDDETGCAVVHLDPAPTGRRGSAMSWRAPAPDARWQATFRDECAEGREVDARELCRIRPSLIRAAGGGRESCRGTQLARSSAEAISSGVVRLRIAR